MIDVATLAQDAMTVLTPMLPLVSAAAGKALDGFLGEPGAKLFDWLSAKVKGTPAETTLARAVAEPEDKRQLQRLQLDLEEMAEKDAGFREELAAKLKEAGVKVTAVQTANQTGSNNTSVQIAGKDNTVTTAR